LNLALIEWTVTTVSSFQLSYAWVAGPMLWWSSIFYFALGMWALLPQYRPRPNRCITMLALWVIAGICAPPLFANDDELHCTFIAVGQGCSVLLELPGGVSILYDAGKMGSPESASRAISAVLWSRGRTHIDSVLISHADADHFNATPDLLQRFSVGAIYVSTVMQADKAPSVQALYKQLRRDNVPLRTLIRGDQFTSGGTTLSVLHPSAAGIEETHFGSIDNANSIVLLV
ncbi:MAG: MBL fold metallo-hydrolase, partial [Planctomycetales bacterium]